MIFAEQKCNELPGFKKFGKDSEEYIVCIAKKTKELGMISLPGCFTATEAHLALDSGADGLKFFPAVNLGINTFKALSAVLPKDLMSFAVGGVDTIDFQNWFDVKITGFGLGSSLYKPGLDIKNIRK